ncbi:hypothetical protein [Veronia pacifica]|uniref:Uncharacterized protein n=1 Tax=Veronia pacifica TaxID=1080227 RepID=A0A1C3EL96_9GAMM|nr:hypothetical protein [Veronia pacifica]ODA34002.1 hypothetical protein A8L45_08120 [Veronia pacifica]
MDYLAQFRQSVEKSTQMGIEPRVVNSSEHHVSFDEKFDRLMHEVSTFLVNLHGDGYRGASCMNFASQVFMFLQQNKIPCELTYGEVKFRSESLYSATQENLEAEWKEISQEKNIGIHVWVTIGEDYVVDPTTVSRVSRHYGMPWPHFAVLHGHQKELVRDEEIEHIPMLVGKNYLEKITSNEIELDYLCSAQRKD